jgi:gamma-glutamylcyclotransferase (GGCT)/AIG2-like uncharacterized protein YtfP
MVWLIQCVPAFGAEYRNARLPSVLYFAYGSNLEPENWDGWCADNGHDRASIEPLGPAWLPDYQPVFHYQSRLRKGGALDVEPRHGTSTPGALFRVHDWAGLDAKEGTRGGYYERIEVTALTDDGRAHSASTYRVLSSRIRDHVTPSRAYFEVVQRGLSRFGHSHAQLVAAANGESLAPQPHMFFTYGTLMRGERRHDLLVDRVCGAPDKARLRGASLVRIDWYPGLVLRDDGLVHGELFEIDDITSAIAELDPYEDFAGYGRSDSLYRRSLVRAESEAGEILAWTYVYLGDHSGLQVIESGVWTGA